MDCIECGRASYYPVCLRCRDEYDKEQEREAKAMARAEEVDE